MLKQRVNGHTVSRLTVHIVWSTKYRYSVLCGDVQKKCRDILIQICDAEGVNILKGVVNKDHVHMHIEYRPSQDISSLVKKFKGRSFAVYNKIFQPYTSVIGVVIFGQ